ncbi:MAG: relaxase/mobilization nuclease domain-containing protein [Mailhella sp.]|nr:relaxase/mobilization nuclease domain-containing protein [Mailhella sp.]
MIAKAIKGKGFRGAVAYDLQKGKSVLLDSNMSAKEKGSVSAFAKEFGAIRALRPNLTKAVCHVSISLHPDEHLSDNDWCKVAQTWLKDMRFTDNQYLVSRHTDTKHPHIHILVNRIRLDGSVVSDSHDYKRQEAVMRRLEKEFGLMQVKNSRETERSSPKKGELDRLSESRNPPCVCFCRNISAAPCKSLCPFGNLRQNYRKTALR